MRHSGGFQSISAGYDRLRLIWADYGRFLGIVGRLQLILIGFGGFWSIPANFGRFQLILVDFNIF